MNHCLTLHINFTGKSIIWSDVTRTLEIEDITDHLNNPDTSFALTGTALTEILTNNQREVIYFSYT